jgi:hypothetical protein
MMKTEKERFDATMKKVLSVSKQELQRRIEEDRNERACSKTHIREDKVHAMGNVKTPRT